MWVPARPSRKVFATVLRVKNQEASAMLSFVTGGQKVAVQKLGCRDSGTCGLAWGHRAAGLFQRCWNKVGNGLEFNHLKV